MKNSHDDISDAFSNFSISEPLPKYSSGAQTTNTNPNTNTNINTNTKQNESIPTLFFPEA